MSLMWCEECYGVMAMNRNVDHCPDGSADVGTGHNVKTRVFLLKLNVQKKIQIFTRSTSVLTHFALCTPIHPELNNEQSAVSTS